METRGSLLFLPSFLSSFNLVFARVRTRSPVELKVYRRKVAWFRSVLETQRGKKISLPCLQQPSKKRSGTRFSSWRAYRVRPSTSTFSVNFFSPPPRSFVPDEKKEFQFSDSTSPPRLASRKRNARQPKNFI